MSPNENNYPSEVQWHNDRVFLALRGDNKVMIFNETGEGKLEQFCAFQVSDWPRHLAMADSGFLYVAAQKGNLVEKYQVTPEKIILHSQLAVTTPSCVLPL